MMEPPTQRGGLTTDFEFFAKLLKELELELESLLLFLPGIVRLLTIERLEGLEHRNTWKVRLQTSGPDLSGRWFSEALSTNSMIKALSKSEDLDFIPRLCTWTLVIRLD